MTLLRLISVLVGKPNRLETLRRVAILAAALCLSGPAMLRWWRALLAVL